MPNLMSQNPSFMDQNVDEASAGRGSEEREVLEAVTCVRPEASACEICKIDA